MSRVVFLLAVFVLAGLALSAPPLAESATPTPVPDDAQAAQPVETVVQPDVARVEPATSNVQPVTGQSQPQTSDIAASEDNGSAIGTIGLAAGAGAAALVLVIGVALRATRRSWRQ